MTKTAAGDRPHPKSRGAARRAMRTGPTLDDVAAVAGVSRGTVSRWLNGGTYVSARARQAVEEAIRQTGYVVNHHARSLVTRRTGSVAFVVSEPQEKLFTDPNLALLLRTVTRSLAQRNRAVVLMLAGTDEEGRRVNTFLSAGHVDGAMIFSPHGDDLLLDAAVNMPIPVVVCGRPLGYEDRLSWISSDDREGARQITRYLVGLGRRRIATITGPLNSPGGVERLAGFRDVLGRKAADALVATGDYSQPSGETAMRLLLARRPNLDAVFAASDMMAAGALAVLAAAGRRVPEDVAVVGFDDSTIASATTPALTTVRQPLVTLAETIAEELVLRIDGAPRREPIILPTEVIVRASA